MPGQPLCFFGRKGRIARQGRAVVLFYLEVSKAFSIIPCNISSRILWPARGDKQMGKNQLDR